MIDDHCSSNMAFLTARWACEESAVLARFVSGRQL